MANLWRDMDLGAFKPYAGAGVGVGLMDVAIDYANGKSVKGLDPGFAAQVGSGIRFNVSDNMMVDIGYRFRAVMAVGTEGSPGTGDRNNSSSYFSHNAQIGVSWKF